jgi:hypothetical protein
MTMSEIDIDSAIIGLAVVPPRPAEGTPANFKTAMYQELAVASKNTPIRIATPSYLPGATRLIDVAVATGPIEVVALTYEDTPRGSTCYLVETILGPSKERHLSVGDSIEPLSIGGRKAAVVELGSDASRNGPYQTTLVWAANDVLLQLTGVGVTRSELVKIAESI